MTNARLDNIRPLNGAWLALFLLFVVSLFNYLDRYVLSILLPSIKDEMALSDTQLGAIAAVFTVSYVLFGIPIARLADRSSRTAIITCCMAFWSAMTALCGLAQNTLQLAVARVMVGIGEAGATPASHSIISDFFPNSMRARALGLWALGGPLGLIIGFVLAGWLVEIYSWRAVFLILGLPGVAIAAAFYFLVSEPKRGSATDEQRQHEAIEAPAFSTVLVTLFRSSTFRNLSIATGLHNTVYTAAVSWLPSYFERSFSMSMSEVGLWLAVSIGVSQLIGTFTAGFFTDYMVARSPRWFCLVPALSMFLSAPLLIIAFGSNSVLVSSICLGLGFCINSYRGPGTFAAIQTIAHIRMRAMAVALLVAVASLLGGLIGPLFTGWLSDFFVANYGSDSLRWSLMIVTGTFAVWAGIHDLFAARSVVTEIEAAA